MKAEDLLHNLIGIIKFNHLLVKSLPPDYDWRLSEANINVKFRYESTEHKLLFNQK